MFPILSVTRRDSGPRLPWRGHARRGLVALAAVLAFAAAVWWQGRLDRELRSMPELERRELYDRTLGVLRGPCLEASADTLAEACADKATFLRHFPECQHECRALAGRFAPLSVH